MTEPKSTHPPQMAHHPAPGMPPKPPATMPPRPHVQEAEHETPPPPRPSGWIGRNSVALAAWAQAIGGVLAIVAAFMIGGSRDRAETAAAEADRQAQKDILAYAVRYELRSLKASFDQILDAQRSQNAAPDRILSAALYIPPELAASRDRLHLLGRAEGLAVQKALSDAQRLVFLLDLIRKDAKGYADYYARRGLADQSGAGTAVYFNGRDFDDAVFALSGSLDAAFRTLDVPARDRL